MDKDIELIIRNDLQREYNAAIDDFYAALAENLSWVKKEYGKYLYVDLLRTIGETARQIEERSENK